MQRTVNAIVLAAALATPWLAHAQEAAPATNYVKLSAGQSDASIDFWGDDTDTVAPLAVGAHSVAHRERWHRGLELMRKWRAENQKP